MGYKVLIADDEMEIRNLLRLYLENDGFSVKEVASGDAVMPEMTAEQATAIAAGCASLAAYIIGEGLVDRASLSENIGTNIENEK